MAAVKGSTEARREKVRPWDEPDGAIDLVATACMLEVALLSDAAVLILLFQSGSD